MVPFLMGFAGTVPALVTSSIAVTADRTASHSDASMVWRLTQPVTITIPILMDGFTLHLVNASSGSVTVQGNGSSVVMDSGDIASIVQAGVTQVIVKGPSAVIS